MTRPVSNECASRQVDGYQLIMLGKRAGEGGEISERGGEKHDWGGGGAKKDGGKRERKEEEEKEK